jgi:SAM-dependent methyltransferase
MNLWKLKIVAKIILSRLPVDYRNWSKVNIFKHGDMDNYEYAVNVLKKHVIHLGVEKGRAWKGIEIGPGDGVMSALLTPIVYGGSVDLVDAGNFINKDIDVYKEHLDKYVDLNPEYNFSGLDFSQGIDGLLKSANSKYYSQGLVSLKLMNSESYNFIFSHAVFEHIRKHEFVDTIRECYRLLTPQGVMSHVVDFKDHLGGGLNNMRFSSSLWESEWFASHSGFYTNRIKLTEMIDICENIGFLVEIYSVNKFEKLPIRVKQLSKEFSDLSNDDLLTSGVHLIMRKL